MTSMTRTQVYLLREQHGRIQDLAHTQSRTMAAIIRDAVDEYLTRHSGGDDPMLDLIALGNSGSGATTAPPSAVNLLSSQAGAFLSTVASDISSITVASAVIFDSSAL